MISIYLSVMIDQRKNQNAQLKFLHVAINKKKDIVTKCFTNSGEIHL